MKKWENKVLYWKEKITSQQKADNLENLLDEYGNEGWELVSITQQIDSSSGTEDGSVSSVETDSLIITLKRAYKESDEGPVYSF